MKRNLLALLILISILMGASAAQDKADKPKEPAKAEAKAPAPAEPPSMTTIFHRQLSGVERQFVPAAEAMPEDKFNFAPSATGGEFKDVRTFAEQVRHVATANHRIAASIMGKEQTVDLGIKNNGPELKTKAEIIQSLKDSFAALHKAMDSVTEKDFNQLVASPFGAGQSPRMGLAMISIWHCFDHYGQMVVYLRMNGIVPPASRQN